MADYEIYNLGTQQLTINLIEIKKGNRNRKKERKEMKMTKDIKFLLEMTKAS